MSSPKALWAIANRYRPRGIKVTWREAGLTPAHADKPKKHILSPRPDTPIGLQYFLHECAHIILDHWSNEMELYEEEYEAEQWAISTLRRHGIRVSKAMLKDAKDNVRSYITPETKVRPHIKRWLKD